MSVLFALLGVTLVLDYVVFFVTRERADLHRRLRDIEFEYCRNQRDNNVEYGNYLWTCNEFEHTSDEFYTTWHYSAAVYKHFDIDRVLPARIVDLGRIGLRFVSFHGHLRHRAERLQFGEYAGWVIACEPDFLVGAVKDDGSSPLTCMTCTLLELEVDDVD